MTLTTIDRLGFDAEFKLATSKPGAFSGYGAIFGNVDAAGDMILAGAFSATLRNWKAKGKFPPMLLQHGGGGFGGNADDLLPVGKWTSMEENAKGLKVEGELFALGTERGQYLYEGLKSGELDGLSIGYRVKSSALGTKPGEPRRTLKELDLVELSIVTFPMNDRARVGTVKAATGALVLKSRAELRDVLRAAGLSRSAAEKVATAGWPALASPETEASELAGEIRAVAALFEKL